MVIVHGDHNYYNNSNPPPHQGALDRRGAGAPESGGLTAVILGYSEPFSIKPFGTVTKPPPISSAARVAPGMLAAGGVVLTLGLLL